MRTNAVALLVVAILATTPAAALAEPPELAPFKESQATHFLSDLLSDGYALIWRDGDGWGEGVTMRLYVNKKRPSVTEHPDSVVVICFPERYNAVSATPLPNAADAQEPKLPSRWILTLQSEKGTMMSHLIDISVPARSLGKQSHPIYFQYPGRVVWAPVIPWKRSVR